MSRYVRHIKARTEPPVGTCGRPTSQQDFACSGGRRPRRRRAAPSAVAASSAATQPAASPSRVSNSNPQTTNSRLPSSSSPPSIKSSAASLRTSSAGSGSLPEGQATSQTTAVRPTTPSQGVPDPSTTTTPSRTAVTAIPVTSSSTSSSNPSPALPTSSPLSSSSSLLAGTTSPLKSSTSSPTGTTGAATTTQAFATSTTSAQTLTTRSDTLRGLPSKAASDPGRPIRGSGPDDNNPADNNNNNDQDRRPGPTQGSQQTGNGSDQPGRGQQQGSAAGTTSSFLSRTTLARASSQSVSTSTSVSTTSSPTDSALASSTIAVSTASSTAATTTSSSVASLASTATSTTRSSLTTSITVTLFATSLPSATPSTTRTTSSIASESTTTTTSQSTTTTASTIPVNQSPTVPTSTVTTSSSVVVTSSGILTTSSTALVPAPLISSSSASVSTSTTGPPISSLSTTATSISQSIGDTSTAGPPTASTSSQADATSSQTISSTFTAPPTTSTTFETASTSTMSAPTSLASSDATATGSRTVRTTTITSLVTMTSTVTVDPTDAAAGVFSSTPFASRPTMGGTQEAQIIGNGPSWAQRNPGTMAGMIVGSMGGVAMLGMFLFLCMRRRAARRSVVESRGPHRGLFARIPHPSLPTIAIPAALGGLLGRSKHNKPGYSEKQYDGPREFQRAPPVTGSPTPEYNTARMHMNGWAGPVANEDPFRDPVEQRGNLRIVNPDGSPAATPMEQEGRPTNFFVRSRSALNTAMAAIKRPTPESRKSFRGPTDISGPIITIRQHHPQYTPPSRPRTPESAMTSDSKYSSHSPTLPYPTKLDDPFMDSDELQWPLETSHTTNTDPIGSKTIRVSDYFSSRPASSLPSSGATSMMASTPSAYWKDRTTPGLNSLLAVPSSRDTLVTGISDPFEVDPRGSLPKDYPPAPRTVPARFQ